MIVKRRQNDSQSPVLPGVISSLLGDGGSSVGSLTSADARTHACSDEEKALIDRAKQIVELKAEELVTKYSQLIEQSEATRLAETVKKVEKRMKVRTYVRTRVPSRT